VATEEGVVIKIDSTAAWVKTTQTSACKGCSARGSCNSMGNDKEREVKAINTAGAKVGDRIVLDLETASLLKVSFLLYVFPILCMIVGAFIGQQIAASFFYFSESAVSAIFGFLFFFIAFLIIKAKGNTLAQKNEYQPKIIRILKAQLENTQIDSSQPTIEKSAQ
jgi:sigma-E factor negative regulatory protein RseC